MKKLFNFIKQRWFISLTGILILGLIIWFLGPLFAFAEYEPLASPINRLVLIVCVFIFWFVLQIIAFFRAKSKNNQVLAAMTSVPETAISQSEQATQEELVILQQRLHNALETLKKTRLGGHSGKQFLYQLPWYILIGPPGSGKTTLLKNSNLKFPLSTQYGKEAIRGIGGTRNCDWWFTEEAVILDTAGRYTTQDSNKEIDQASWSGFLDLLKKYRRRRPINGAVIAVSITDLIEKNIDEQKQHAYAIRKRIQELQEHFGIQFPVYFLFTKCDLLAGFMEYFDDLQRDDFDQVWGVTFKLDEDLKQNNVELFETEFSALEQRLHEQIIEKLQNERGVQRRNFIYTFPQQFSSLKKVIHNFLEQIFEPTQYESYIMFRGVYFTSATQEGTPIDRIMGSLAQNFGLERQNLANGAGSGKSFFINQLLQNVIFNEYGLAGTNLKFEKKRLWAQRLTVIGLIGISILAGLIWLNSFFQNRSYIKDITVQTETLKENINNLSPGENDPVLTLAILDNARNLPGGYNDKDKSSPWSLSFGLYQGDKLGNASISLYQNLLKEIFLPRLMVRLEQQLRDNTNNPDYLYQALKVYLMLGDSKHYDKETIYNWITLDWKHNLPINVSNEQRQSLDENLLALLEVRLAPLPRPLDTTLVVETRNILNQTPMSERVYTLLKLELENTDIPDFRINEKAGRDALLVFATKSGKSLTQGVPGLFTCKGYQNVFLHSHARLTERLLGETWVLGTTQNNLFSITELKNLQEDVLKKYYQDYIQHWDLFLNDIQIKPFSNQAQMVEVLNIISSKNSPVRRLLEAVNKETSLNCLSRAEKSLLDKASKKLSTAKSTLDKIIRQAPIESDISASSEIKANIITQHFKDLHLLVQSEDSIPAPLDHSLSLLNELYVYLNSLLHASGDELVLEQRQQVTQVIDKVKLNSKRSSFPVNIMMENIAKNSHALVSGGVRKHLNEMWKATILPFCKQAIKGLYPINTNSAREITYEDFTYFFAPGGLMDEYFNKYLASSVDRSGRNWRWNNQGNKTAGISSAALKQFQYADTIKNVFFRLGRQSPKVSFKLKPISMDSTITQFILDVDGKMLNYAHGPTRPVSMQWPGPNNSGQVRIQFLPALDGFSGHTKEGPWALFQLFDDARITRTSNPSVFIVTFKIQNREAKFELRASSAVNPFELNDLKSFRCVNNL
jgi:type VI secretion system protein ImpL